MAPPKFKLVATVASEAMGIGKSSDVLTVLGGKASCRRKFVLNLHLLDENGNLAPQDMSIIASVAYAHDHALVVRDDKQFLAEPPLFTTFNGVEFPAQERPTRMVCGRASFKLAISLLSSKCDNRLFCICFTPQSPAPPCEPCYSKPIRSISRKRTQPTSPPTLNIHPQVHQEKSSLSLSLSPVSESESPNSVVENKELLLDQNGVGNSSPVRNVVESDVSKSVKAFRPYARVPVSAFAFARSASENPNSLDRLQPSSPGLNVSPSVQQNGNNNNNKNEPASLEEEEKSLHYIEVSLQEVHRELQRRKEELVSKKRRLLEDDTRMHSIIFQSSSWIESLCVSYFVSSSS